MVHRAHRERVKGDAGLLPGLSPGVTGVCGGEVAGGTEALGMVTALQQGRGRGWGEGRGAREAGRPQGRRMLTWDPQT